MLGAVSKRKGGVIDVDRELERDGNMEEMEGNIEILFGVYVS